MDFKVQFVHSSLSNALLDCVSEIDRDMEVYTEEADGEAKKRMTMLVLEKVATCCTGDVFVL